MGNQGIQSLRDRVDELKDVFLPNKSPTGTYSREDYAQTAAFVLLVHAEIEWFIEERCRKVLSSAVELWAQDNRPRSTVLSLVAFCNTRKDILRHNSRDGRGSRRSLIRDIVDDAKRMYSDLLHKNHGIREKNLLTILRPIGVREFELSTTFLADMDTFGTVRAGHAHRSIGAHTPLDPVEASKLIERILESLSLLDKRLQQLENEELCKEEED